MNQFVLVYIRLRDSGYPSSRDCEDLFNLHGELSAALEAAEAGKFDHEEFGEGACVLEFYGPDADRLFAAMEPALKANSMAKGGYVIKRFGDEDDPDTREVRVDW